MGTFYFNILQQFKTFSVVQQENTTHDDSVQEHLILSLRAAQFWQSDIITVTAAIAPLFSFFLFQPRGSGVCAGGSFTSESDAQIPETSFHCCIKAARARGDGMKKNI